MLLSFEVSNFKGIGQPQTLDFIANASTEYEESLVTISESLRINKQLCIIGPNSSGKSHLLESISCFANCIKQVDKIKSAYKPFLLDEKSSSEPTAFTALLFDQKTDCFIEYSFSVFKGAIINEYLSSRDNKKNAKNKSVFTRNKSGLKFSSEYKSTQKLLDESIDVGGLVSNYATSIKVPELKFIHNWATKLLLLTSDVAKSGTKIAEELFNDKEFEESREFLQELILEKSIDIFKNLALPISNISINEGKDGKYYFKIKPSQSENSQIELTLSEAKDYFSSGTYSALSLILLLLMCNLGNTTLLIDEYDGNLHHKLSKAILDFIRLRNEDGNGSITQTVMTTHDIMLVDYGFRRDSILVLKKDNNFSTVIKKISEFSLRKDAKISAKYLSDEFGFLPNIIGENDV
ncbi:MULTISPECIES: AAA family ATPase [Pseudoalteromonas]|jgi:AAA15 family ATPase/GTPase|uniref:AAA family ATPase n=1 Tax=Pseudoalteromonas TaxID=53246 RepID=UPI00051A7AB7|nr:ATP-binding protein [Pseudoalteromonas sp. ND6B]KGK03044.1 hypothetical protein ND6B_0438 [Pseudoalteromonas sp. ND6B]